MNAEHKTTLLLSAASYAAASTKIATAAADRISELRESLTQVSFELLQARIIENRANLAYMAYKVRWDESAAERSDAHDQRVFWGLKFQPAKEALLAAAIAGDEEAILVNAIALAEIEDKREAARLRENSNHQFLLDSEPYTQVCNARRDAARAIEKANAKHADLCAKLEAPEQEVRLANRHLNDSCRDLLQAAVSFAKL